MSLIEWFGEHRNPGPIGQLELGKLPAPRLRTRWTYLKDVFAVALAAGIFFCAQGDAPLLKLALFGVYLLASFFIQVRPDYSNVGWAGGVVDHPFRWSDDANRP